MISHLPNGPTRHVLGAALRRAIRVAPWLAGATALGAGACGGDSTDAVEQCQRFVNAVCKKQQSCSADASGAQASVDAAASQPSPDAGASRPVVEAATAEDACEKAKEDALTAEGKSCGAAVSVSATYDDCLSAIADQSCPDAMLPTICHNVILSEKR